MPYNGFGNFSLVYDWVQDRNNGIKILASRMMGQEQDIADGLSNCITADGQTTVTNAIPMSDNQITLLASATTRAGATNLGQIVDGSAMYASASGTNTYVADLDPAVTTIPDGMTVRVYFPNTNTSAATASLNLNNTGARNLVVGSGTLVSAGTVKAGVGIVVANGSIWQYFGSIAPSGPFGLADGGYLATGATAELNTAYMVDCSGTARSITIASAAATGDSLAFTIFGTNNCSLWAGGKYIYGTAATADTFGNEGLALPRYTGTVRGWVW